VGSSPAIDLLRDKIRRLEAADRRLVGVLPFGMTEMDAHLHGDEDAMLRDMVVRLAAADIRARAAMADSWGAAHAFARASSKPVMVIPP
jgi:hypothetical protein